MFLGSDVRINVVQFTGKCFGRVVRRTMGVFPRYEIELDVNSSFGSRQVSQFGGVGDHGLRGGDEVALFADGRDQLVV